jgi:diketogulonate reductase-like aldo/keto reductase
MEKRELGRTGVQVPTIGQGTWNLERASRADAIAALRRGIDLGMAHIDTAEMYGSGEVEELVGEAIAGRRNEVFLASKVLPHHASLKGTIQACEQSLERLKTDWLDLYMIHWPGTHPIQETVEAFARLHAAGKIRAFGVSNFDVDELERAEAAASPGHIACDQVLYHLEERTIENALLLHCQAQGVALVGYSPFGSGRFPTRQSRGGLLLEEIARAHGATPRQVALRFLVRERGVFAIPKSSSVAHVEENAAAAALELSEEDIRQIDGAFPRGKPRRGVPTL